MALTVVTVRITVRAVTQHCINRDCGTCRILQRLIQCCVTARTVIRTVTTVYVLF